MPDVKDLLTTDGRIPRSTYWKFFAFFYAFCIVVGLFGQDPSLPEWAQVVLGLVALPVLLTGLIVQIKRWHDRDKSGWWVLINFIPILGGLWSLIECGFLKGTNGRNGYGRDPLKG